MIMSPLQFFIAVLTLFPSISLAVTPAQVPPHGKAQGFISNLDDALPIPTGDWLVSTMCYCRLPFHNPEISSFEKAHIFQHEYYNYHSDSTFVLDHLCLAKAHYEGDQCVHPNIGGDNNDWWQKPEKGDEWTCKHFRRTEEEKILQGNSKRIVKRDKLPRTPPVCVVEHCDPGPYGDDPPEKSSHPNSDKVCFRVGNNFYGTRDFQIKFNWQRRRMDAPGEQGRVKTQFYKVYEYCENMCQNTFGMPADMEIADKRADGGSRQFVYTDLDDMCDHCR